MINFNNYEKRWLEIVFYFLCRKIFSINQNQQDIIDFIKGYRWTNLFEYDILIDALTKHKILLDNSIAPSKREFIVAIAHPECRLKMHRTSIQELIRNTEYTYKKRDRFHTAMKEEIIPTEIFPKFNTPRLHETIYSFLIALHYITDIIKTIKF